MGWSTTLHRAGIKPWVVSRRDIHPPLGVPGAVDVVTLCTSSSSLDNKRAGKKQGPAHIWDSSSVGLPVTGNQLPVSKEKKIIKHLKKIILVQANTWANSSIPWRLRHLLWPPTAFVKVKWSGYTAEWAHATEKVKNLLQSSQSRDSAYYSESHGCLLKQSMQESFTPVFGCEHHLGIDPATSPSPTIQALYPFYRLTSMTSTLSWCRCHFPCNHCCSLSLSPPPWEKGSKIFTSKEQRNQDKGMQHAAEPSPRCHLASLHNLLSIINIPNFMDSLQAF